MTGLEIVEMIAKGEAPKKIKINGNTYEFQKEFLFYQNENMNCIDLIKCLNEEFEIIEEPKVWKPKYDDEYWFIDDGVHILRDFWDDSNVDIVRYEIGNCFRIEEEAEKALEKLKIYTQLKRYAEEHNEEKIDWNKKWQTKWFICYDFEDKIIISLDTKVIKDIGQVYFTSKRIAEQAIEDIGEENIKKLFEQQQ